MTTDRPEELGFTAVIDGDHDRVRTFARMHADGAVSDRERAVRLYYAVRDGIRYDPYRIDLSVDGMRASRCLAVAISLLGAF